MDAIEVNLNETDAKKAKVNKKRSKLEWSLKNYAPIITISLLVLLLILVMTILILIIKMSIDFNQASLIDIFKQVDTGNFLNKSD
jgi:hypothetical protein